MKTVISSPFQYIQAAGELHHLADHVSEFGNSVYLLLDPFLAEHYSDIILSSIQQQNLKYQTEVFQGECTKDEIRKQLEKAMPYSVILAIGGGKVMDVGKAAAHYAGKPLLIVPGSAATDSPCSAIAVLYREDGSLEEYLYLPSAPERVIVDTDLILNAPPRLLIAGIGDALSTYFEASLTYRAGGTTPNGGKTAQAALALSEGCLKILLRDGEAAVQSCRDKTPSEAFERVVEAILYLSGIGFESGGLSVAHAFHNALTALPESRYSMHGEKIAYTTLLQLLLEENETDFQTIFAFCKKLGLPTTLSDLKMEKVSEDTFLQLFETCLAESAGIHYLPKPVTANRILKAVLTLEQKRKS